MDSPQTPPVKRSLSKIPHVPSFNDFCSGVEQDMAMPELKMPGPSVAVATKLDRSWSLDSDEFTPRSASSTSSGLERRASFAQTFSRALYEHMRTN